MNRGLGYYDTEGIRVTTEQNEEIIDSPPSEWGWTIPFYFYKFSFINYQDCHFLINGKNRFFRKANQGFEAETFDNKITSFIIEEEGIEYQYTGGY